MLVYLNGEYLPHEQARVSVDDRGFLFADGVYEVARVYGGRLFLLDQHLARLRDGLAALSIAQPAEDLAGVAERLLAENGLGEAEAIVYYQITRGTAPRKHAFPAGVLPTVYAAAKPYTDHPPAYYAEGIDALTVSDTRWSRCDIKSISLLPNVLANQQAHAAGAFEALFVRDGVVIEGSHSNLFAVYDGTLLTYPVSNYILAGITRRRVLEMAAALEIPAREAPILADRLFDAQELFLSGTTTEIMPVARVDGRPIGNGAAGPITLRLQAEFRRQSRD